MSEVMSQTAGLNTPLNLLTTCVPMARHNFSLKRKSFRYESLQIIPQMGVDSASFSYCPPGHPAVIQRKEGNRLNDTYLSCGF